MRGCLCIMSMVSARGGRGVPAEQVMTPFFFSSPDRLAIMLYAPRILNENTGWRSSRLIQIYGRFSLEWQSCTARTSLPRRAERLTA